MGAYAFRLLILGFNYVLFTYPKSIAGDYGELIVVITPTIGGLLVGSLIYFAAREAKGHGVPEVIEAVNLNDGIMRARVPFIKIIASAITIGTNGSAGREGPIAQIGAGFASILGAKRKLSKDHQKTLVISGVSAGIAATFNAPLGGILFGLEIIRRDQRNYSISPLVISSVIGTFVGQQLLGASPAFTFPPFGLNNTFSHVPILIGLGIFIGIIAIIWVKTFYFIETLFDNLSIHPILVAGFGGLLVGLIELALPEVSGINYVPIDQAFDLKFGIQALVILFVGKVLATSISIGSGGSGGVFAPSLFQGVMMGSAFGLIIVKLGSTIIPVEVYALLGMAAIFAASTKAPLTAIVMTSEMVNDFALIVPLMFVVITAWLVSEIMLPDDIYIIKLRNRGVEFTPSIDNLDDVSVREAMSKDVIQVSPKDRIETILDLMMETGHTGYPVTDDGKLIGIITEHDVDKALKNTEVPDLIVSEVCNRKVVHILPFHSLSFAFSIMGHKNVNRLPVVNSDQHLILIGWLTRSDIMRQYYQIKSLKRSQEYSDDILQKYEDEQSES